MTEDSSVYARAGGSMRGRGARPARCRALTPGGSTRLSALPLVALLALACHDDGFGPEVVISEPFEYTLDATDRSGFQLIGVNGDVVVTGVTGNEFRVTGYRRVENCRRSAAESWIDRLEVTVTAGGPELIVRTDQPENTSPCSLIVHYELTVPRGLEARVTNVNGAIVIDGLIAGVSVTAVNGAVTLDDVEHDTTVRLTNGPIVAHLEIDGDQQIDLLTVNGAIDLAIPAATDAMVHATVVNGVIAVSNLQLADAVSTLTTLSGRLGTGMGEISLRSTNGAISLRGM